MKSPLAREIERDCVGQMFPCFILHFLREALALALPVVTSWMIGDMADALLTLDLTRIRARLGIFLLAFLLEVLVQPAVRLWENLLMTRLGFAYGNQMFGRYLRLPMKAARAVDTATLVQRIDTDTTDYYFLLMEKWTRPLTMALYLAVLAVMLIARRTSPVFVLVMALLAALPLARAAVNSRAKARLKKSRRDYEESRENMEYAMFSARDFLHGFGIGERYVGRMHRAYAAYAARTGAAQDRMDASDDMFGYLCAYGVPLGVISAGALLIACGRMGLGALLAGYLIMPTVTEFYQYFGSLVVNLRGEKVTRERLEIFYGEREEDGGPVHLDMLRLEHVTFSYGAGEKPVLADQTAAIPLTGNTRITGPNGAGKSTLLYLLAGIYRPDRGAVRDGNGRALDSGALRATVALLEQDGQIFSATVAENLFLDDEERRNEADALLREMGFEKPLGYQITESGGNLSPGEKKKLLLVRALCSPAPVLALDEPLNHLDERGKKMLMGRLKGERRPVILVSHMPVEGVDWKEIAI